MSYSFTIRAASKAKAKALVAAEFDKVVASQVCHARDRAPVEACVSEFVDVLGEDDSKDVEVRVSGSLSGTWTTGNDLSSISGASASVSAALVTKAAA